MIKRSLKAIAVAAILVGATGAAAPQAEPQGKSCSFYQDFDYLGGSFNVAAGEAAITNPNVDAKRVYKNAVPGKTTVLSNLSSQTSSLKVGKGCTALVYNGKDQVGISANLPKFAPHFNDKSVGFGCVCK